MLHFVLFDPPTVTGDILAGDAPVFLHFGSNSGNNVGSFLGFPFCGDGADCQWFHQSPS
jgi:hypothetical protein